MSRTSGRSRSPTTHTPGSRSPSNRKSRLRPRATTHSKKRSYQFTEELNQELKELHKTDRSEWCMTISSALRNNPHKFKILDFQDHNNTNDSNNNGNTKFKFKDNNNNNNMKDISHKTRLLISKEEFETHLKDTYDAEVIGMIWDELDKTETNQVKLLTIHKFIHRIKTPTSTCTDKHDIKWLETELKNITFASLDIHGSGKVSKEDFYIAFESDNVDKEILDSVFKQINKSKDGNITVMEFAKWQSNFSRDRNKRKLKSHDKTVKFNKSAELSYVSDTDSVLSERMANNKKKKKKRNKQRHSRKQSKTTEDLDYVDVLNLRAIDFTIKEEEWETETQSQSQPHALSVTDHSDQNNNNGSLDKDGYKFELSESKDIGSIYVESTHTAHSTYNEHSEHTPLVQEEQQSISQSREMLHITIDNIDSNTSVSTNNISRTSNTVSSNSDDYTQQQQEHSTVTPMGSNKSYSASAETAETAESSSVKEHSTEPENTYGSSQHLLSEIKELKDQNENLKSQINDLTNKNKKRKKVKSPPKENKDPREGKSQSTTTRRKSKEMEKFFEHNDERKRPEESPACVLFGWKFW